MRRLLQLANPPLVPKGRQWSCSIWVLYMYKLHVRDINNSAGGPSTTEEVHGFLSALFVRTSPQLTALYLHI